MNWEELQKYIKDKVFLIGLTFVDSNEKLIEQHQTHGTVVELTNGGIFRFMKKDGSIFQMPYDKESIQKSRVG